jgi:hypothetical protein
MFPAAPDQTRCMESEPRRALAGLVRLMIFATDKSVIVVLLREKKYYIIIDRHG